MTVFARASNVEHIPVKLNISSYGFDGHGVSHQAIIAHELKFTDLSLLDPLEGIEEGSLFVVITNDTGETRLVLAESYEQTADGVYKVPEYQIVKCVG